ncbi:MULTISPECIES: hypothetical protein [unclassified Rhodococcus (in: high G+C Gram-positive bacteria)]|uniref:hypothetical protein n=1 Tax=unclassified Rhodococcus (in: high G+C Gram-positive bacteria) TaxID=192944 RepID=UPI000B0FC000|nr:MULTISPECIES: hypothetical protein [unclassified Rhodococcus (in: high G+C Gram-positive bacteria)]MCY4671593.1 hypothetical protein [Rhodococcus sp. (in: high G+C Gram-positive bacteria)]
MTDVSADQIARELRLTPEHMLTLRALQARMLRRDWEDERKPSARSTKQDRLQRFVAAAINEVLTSGALPPALAEELTTVTHKHFLDQLHGLTSLAPTLAQKVHPRSASVVILAELITFSPWTDATTWGPGVRKTELRTAADDLTALRKTDLDAMTNEFESLMKALRRKSIKWGRVAAVSVIGVGAGALTAGWAAAPIGAAIGGTMGLTGAAAVSAGLAMLGGGSLAAGGFGVAGGTLLLTGVGGLAGAGVAAAGVRYSPLGSQAIAGEAVKLDLVARMVLADAPDRDEKMRRVVESLQERLNDVTDRIGLLVETINTLKQEKAATSAENTELRARVRDLEAELIETKQAQTTLELVRERLPEKIIA